MLVKFSLEIEFVVCVAFVGIVGRPFIAIQCEGGSVPRPHLIHGDTLMGWGVK